MRVISKTNQMLLTPFLTKILVDQIIHKTRKHCPQRRCNLTALFHALCHPNASLALCAASLTKAVDRLFAPSKQGNDQGLGHICPMKHTLHATARHGVKRPTKIERKLGTSKARFAGDSSMFVLDAKTLTGNLISHKLAMLCYNCDGF